MAFNVDVTNITEKVFINQGILCNIFNESLSTKSPLTFTWLSTRLSTKVPTQPPPPPPSYLTSIASVGLEFQEDQGYPHQYSVYSSNGTIQLTALRLIYTGGNITFSAPLSNLINVQLLQPWFSANVIKVRVSVSRVYINTSVTHFSAPYTLFQILALPYLVQ